MILSPAQMVLPKDSSFNDGDDGHQGPVGDDARHPNRTGGKNQTEIANGTHA
jgi:hypothetical protein